MSFERESRTVIPLTILIFGGAFSSTVFKWIKEALKSFLSFISGLDNLFYQIVLYTLLIIVALAIIIIVFGLLAEAYRATVLTFQSMNQRYYDMLLKTESFEKDLSKCSFSKSYRTKALI